MTEEDTTAPITSNSNDDGAAVVVASGDEVVATFEKAYRDALAAFKADKTNKDLRRARTAAKKAWDASVLKNCLQADNGAEQLYCKDCSQKFLWTTEEQDYYKDPERNWKHKPLRCRNCAEMQKGRRRHNNNDDPDGVAVGDGDEKTENDGENKKEVKKGGKGRHMCYAFQRGECKYGDECKFNHDPDFAGKKKEEDSGDDNNEDGENGDGEATSKKRKVVPDVIPTCKWGKECNLKRCRFKHGDDEVPSPPPPTSKSAAKEATNDGNGKDKKGDDKNVATATPPPSKKQKIAVTGICKWGKDCKLKRCRFRHDDSSPLPPVDDKGAVCVEVKSTTA